MLQGLHHGEREREQDAERDRHVHIERALADGLQRAVEERPAGVSDGRQRDKRGQPVQKIARRIALRPCRAAPERDRDQHDVHGAERGDAQATQQALFLGRLDVVELLRREGIGGIAEALQPVDYRAGRERLLVPFDGDALAREIDPRAANAALAAEALFDRADAGAAMDALDDEVHRGHAFGGMPDVDREILRLAHVCQPPAGPSVILFWLKNFCAPAWLASITSVHLPSCSGGATPS